MRKAYDLLRALAFFTPWLLIPLAFLGVALLVTYPLMVLAPYGWICAPVALLAAIALAAYLKPRYKVAILDSSPLGVFYWLQRRS